MVKPIRIFFIVFIFLLALGIPSLFVPSVGFRIGTFTIKYPAISHLFRFNGQPDTGRAKQMEYIQHLGLLMDSLELQIPQGLQDPPPDSTRTDTVAKRSTKRIEPRVLGLQYSPVGLEYPDSSQGALVQFFTALAQGQNRMGTVRVLHYGDSQIEGDRITSNIRRNMQREYGGVGVGLLPMLPNSYQPAGIVQSASSNWSKITLADLSRSKSLGNRFGILGGYCTFKRTGNPKAAGGFSEASVIFSRTSGAQSTFNRVRLLFSEVSEPFAVSVVSQGKAIDAEIVGPKEQPDALILSVAPTVKRFSVDLKGDASPVFFGVSLEGTNGLLVDNIAIRGSSGNIFLQADPSTLRSLYDMLNVRLIILQFGVNLVPHIVANYDYYERQMYQQILALKAAAPQASVVVIGVSDMARKEDNSFVSYPNIEAIRNAQRKAALKGNAAFWDCYEAMGGKNSMVSWVNANPPLASKDYIHFSNRGANLIAEMFYMALTLEYDRFVSQQPHKSNPASPSQTDAP